MRTLAAVVGLTTSLLLAGCAVVARPPARELAVTAYLHGHPLTLHLAGPAAAAAPAALVLYASGDGGWFGAAVRMFRAIANAGHPVVGISSRAFLKIEGPGHASLSPAELARDYAAILARARDALALPRGTPAILTGWSRGASFAVLAAGAAPSPIDAAGLVAIGLPEGDSLTVDGPDDETDSGPSSPRTAWPFAPYDTLARDVVVPAAVIQATGDDYLPAARARTLFGPDSATRRFVEVPGRNHRFGGAESSFEAALDETLRWVSAGGAGTPARATDTVWVRGHELTVHTYGARGGRPIVLTSGDGGWIHLGPQVAEALAQHGCFVVGVDARAYLSSFTSGATTLRPEDEPGDYRVIAEFAARGATAKPVLVGVSEGAGLSLLAATDPRTREAIAGVIGLGLPDWNELGWRWKDALIYVTHATPNEPLFSTAALASRVAPLPLAAIHSTHDEFVPLADVQRVLAAAREPKRLWIVEAADHRFSDAFPELDRRLVEALAWIAGPHPPTP